MAGWRGDVAAANSVNISLCKRLKRLIPPAMAAFGCAGGLAALYPTVAR